MKKFSIIIPTYNCSDSIAAALDSIIGQSYKNYEVLVLDGESTDETLSILKAYLKEDNRITCFVEQDNGIYDAMNKGIMKSKGEWLFFLGSDDSFYDSQVLADIERVINYNPTAQLVYGNVLLNQPLGEHHEGLLYAGEFDGEKLLTKNICHQSAFYHRSLFKKYGLFRTDYQIFADYDFNLRCFNRVKSIFIERIIANFNVGGHSKNHQHLDRGFYENFLENMALRYAFSYKSPFFAGHKKELFNIMRKRLRRCHLYDTWKISRIISYQILKDLSLKKTKNRTNKTLYKD